MNNTMREILFRGQTRRYGEKLLNVAGDKMPSNWVYGGIFQGPNKSIIYGYEPVEKHVVYTDTVGQYTGLNDKNGNKIFEGDIVTYDKEDGGETRNKGTVYWCDGAFWVENVQDDNDIVLLGALLIDQLGVIGNIHDNPELLEGSNE